MPQSVADLFCPKLNRSMLDTKAELARVNAAQAALATRQALLAELRLTVTPAALSLLDLGNELLELKHSLSARQFEAMLACLPAEQRAVSALAIDVACDYILAGNEGLTDSAIETTLRAYGDAPGSEAVQ
jgi:hypothetical protein